MLVHKPRPCRESRKKDSRLLLPRCDFFCPGQACCRRSQQIVLGRAAASPETEISNLKAGLHSPRLTPGGGVADGHRMGRSGPGAIHLSHGGQYPSPGPPAGNWPACASDHDSDPAATPLCPSMPLGLPVPVASLAGLLP